jgi:NADH:ubiquinone oxidoreductase subunit 2 (subunit N)
VGAYYYLKIMVMMYMREAREEVPVLPIPLALGTALVLTLAATVYLGVVPGRMLTFVQQSAQQLLKPEHATFREQVGNRGIAAQNQ